MGQTGVLALDGMMMLIRVAGVVVTACVAEVKSKKKISLLN